MVICTKFDRNATSGGVDGVACLNVNNIKRY